jgi:hypothetical protein
MGLMGFTSSDFCPEKTPTFFFRHAVRARREIVAVARDSRITGPFQISVKVELSVQHAARYSRRRQD